MLPTVISLIAKEAGINVEGLQKNPELIWRVEFFG